MNRVIEALQREVSLPMVVLVLVMGFVCATLTEAIVRATGKRWLFWVPVAVVVLSLAVHLWRVCKSWK